MKRLCVCAITVVLGCNAIPALLPIDESPEMNVVLGGIADVRPFFGKMRTYAGREDGDFLLATCGCGDWRALITNADGSQAQFPVKFYTHGEYSPNGAVTVYGREDWNALLGDVDQDAGGAAGDLQLGLPRRLFSAERGDSHSLEIEACVMCHIGEEPIWPQPPGHPTYVPGATDCFTCHDVLIE